MSQKALRCTRSHPAAPRDLLVWNECVEVEAKEEMAYRLPLEVLVLCIIIVSPN